MEINTNLGAGQVNGQVSFSRPAPVTTAVDNAAFSQSIALESDLKNLPASRPGAVEHARSLIGDVNYPPQETIRKISLLLAIQMDS